jgi:hypothetical protein
MVSRLALLPLLAAPLLGGCYTTTVRSGLPPAGPPTIAHDEAWHHGVALGMGELSGPYDMPEECPNGWAEIRTETSFVNGLAELISFHLYNPQTVTVVCARAPAPAPVMLPGPGRAVPGPVVPAPPPSSMPPPPSSMPLPPPAPPPAPAPAPAPAPGAAPPPLVPGTP